jgi:Uma2 family endonuclease
MNAARKFATYQDVLKAPASLVAELVQGILHTTPRPAPKHANAATGVAGHLRVPFDRGRNGPGGWVILIEPELHLGSDVLVPDVAAWRRERMPKLPEAAFIELAPDWVCEVLSPSTARFDRTEKMPVYLRAGVSFLWLIEPSLKTLEIYQRSAASGASHWLLINTYSDASVVHPEPFAQLPFNLQDVWEE